MSEIRQDFHPAALIESIEANLGATFAAFARAPGVELHGDARGVRVATGIPHPVMNGVFQARLSAAEADAHIEEIVAHFRSRRLPFLWWLDTGTQPDDLGRRLEAHGFAPAGEALGMVIDLQRMKEDLPVPAGLTIEPVGDRATREAWGRACFAGFDVPEELIAPWCDLMAGLGLGPDLPIRSYLARLHGEPVGTSQLSLAEGVAGIYTVATVPLARRQGIGAAVTLAALQAGRAAGYRIGILQVSSMGASVYRRIGFEGYCKLPLYAWSPEET